MPEIAFGLVVAVPGLLIVGLVGRLEQARADSHGADEPYAKLQRALRAEVDEQAWASLYRTRSRPFPPPTSGKIAVKVVNHYGDEVLQVYDVR